MVYSGRGLVDRRTQNLQLFNILYWVVLVTYVVLFFVVFLPTRGLEDNEDMCSKKGLFSTKQRWLAFFFGSLDCVAVEIFEKMKKNSVRKQCLNMKMFSALGGGKRRNIFTGAETRRYWYVYLASIFIEEFLLMKFLEYKQIDKDTSAILHNLFWILILGFFFSLYLPINHLIESKENFPELWIKQEKVEISEFYIRKPELEPRRDELIMLKSKSGDKTVECEASCSYDVRNKENRKRSHYRSEKAIRKGWAAPGVSQKEKQRSRRRRRRRSVTLKQLSRRSEIKTNFLHTIVEMPDIEV